jgi:hypothetical protein
MDPTEFCRAELARLADSEPRGADRAAVASLLMHFISGRPTAALFLESLRALSRDPSNGSLAAAAIAINEAWHDALRRAQSEAEPIRLRADDRADIRAGLERKRIEGSRPRGNRPKKAG